MTEENKQSAGAEKNPHIFKPGHTQDEVEELLAWFGERKDRLPKTLQLNEATTAPDLRRTVGALMQVLEARKGHIDAAFSGYMAHLEMIRLRLKEQGME